MLSLMIGENAQHRIVNKKTKKIRMRGTEQEIDNVQMQMFRLLKISYADITCIRRNRENILIDMEITEELWPIFQNMEIFPAQTILEKLSGI